MNISVIGSGYVGLVTGICLASLGMNVLCCDVDEEKIKMLEKGILPIYEPELDGFFEKVSQAQIQNSIYHLHRKCCKTFRGNFHHGQYSDTGG